MRHPDSQRNIVKKFCAGGQVVELAREWETTRAAVLDCLRWALDGYNAAPPPLGPRQFYRDQQERPDG